MYFIFHLIKFSCNTIDHQPATFLSYKVYSRKIHYISFHFTLHFPAFYRIFFYIKSSPVSKLLYNLVSVFSLFEFNFPKASRWFLTSIMNTFTKVQCVFYADRFPKIATIYRLPMCSSKWNSASANNAQYLRYSIMLLLVFIIQT